MVETLSPTPAHGDAYDAATRDIPTAAPYEFLQVNGFVYRGNRQTGEMWKLEPNGSDKKTQVWKKIDDATAVVQ